MKPLRISAGFGLVAQQYQGMPGSHRPNRGPDSGAPPICGVCGGTGPLAGFCMGLYPNGDQRLCGD